MKKRIKIFLVVILLIVNIVSIMFTINIFKITNEISEKQFFTLNIMGLSSAWSAADADIEILRFIWINRLFYPAILQETYGYYLNAKSFLSTGFFIAQDSLKTLTSKINNFKDYDAELQDYKSTYNNLTDFILKNNDKIKSLNIELNHFFVYLIITQIFSFILGLTPIFF